MLPHKYFQMVVDFYQGDYAKAWSWFTSANPNLGGMSPLSLVKKRQEKKVMAFIQSRMII